MENSSGFLGRIRPFLVSLSIALILSCLSACGGGSGGVESFDSFQYEGGTVGIGKEKVDFYGTLTNEQGEALANVEVVVPETGETTITDTAGNFRIQLDKATRNVEVAFRGEGVTANSASIAIPENAVLLNVEFVLDEDTGTVDTDKVEVLTENGDAIVESEETSESTEEFPQEDVATDPVLPEIVEETSLSPPDEPIEAPTSPVTENPATDADEDGVLDSIDNCIDFFNPEQVDSDGDGFGNICDCDFSQRGVVSQADIDELFYILNGQLSFSEEYDLNGNGEVDSAEIGLCQFFLGSAPGRSAVGDVNELEAEPRAVPALRDNPAEYVSPEPEAPAVPEADDDNDGVANSVDNCPNVANTGQWDGDFDGIGDACDNCIESANSLQLDFDNDGFGNSCDCDFGQNAVVGTDDISQIVGSVGGNNYLYDINEDGFVDFTDSNICANEQLGSAPGPSAFASPEDLFDNTDSDGDGVIDALDNCVDVYNPSQTDANNDGFGNVCDADINNDGVVDYDDRIRYSQLGVHGSYQGEPNYRADCDFDENGKIDYADRDYLEAVMNGVGLPGPAGPLA